MLRPSCSLELRPQIVHVHESFQFSIILAKSALSSKAKEFHAKVEELEPANLRTIWMEGAIAALEADREKVPRDQED